MRKRFFYRLVVTGCACMLVPVLVIGLIYFRSATDSRRAGIMAMVEANLQLLQSGLEDRMHTVEVESLRLATDPLVTNAFSVPGYEEQYWEHMKTLDRFASQCHLNPFLYDVVFYSARDGFLLSNMNGYLPPERYRQMANIQAAMDAPDKAAWVKWPLVGAEGSIAFVRKLPVLRAQSSEGLLIYIVHQDTLAEALSPTDEIFDSVVVFSRSDTLLVEPGSGVDLSLYLDAGHTAYGLNGASGSFRVRGEDGEQQALYRRSESALYLTLFPAGRLDSLIRQTGWYIVLVVALMIVLGVALIYITSRYEYDPIRRLMREGAGGSQYPPPAEATDEFAYIRQCWTFLDQRADSLAAHIERVEPEVKDVLFSRLLRGEGGERLSDLDGFGGVRPDGSAAVLVLAIRQFEEHAGPNERTLLHFAVRNVLNERISQAEGLEGYALRADDAGIAVILQTRDGADAEGAEAFAWEARAYLEQSLPMGVSVGVGRAYPVSAAHTSYLEAAAALSARALDETTGVYPYAQGEETGDRAVMFYPREEEARLLGALEAGQTRQAVQALDEFHRKLRLSQSLNFLLSCYDILFSALARSFAQRSGNLADFLGGGLMEQLRQLRDPTDVRRWFQSVVLPRYALYLGEDVGSATRRAVVAICAYIRENPRADLSLTECAARVRMNPSHISSAFRAETGMTFTEYVHGCQVEEIKRLLLTTDLRLGDIAETLGMSERSLNRIFLKRTGVTPGQYRREQQGDES